jgi:hypothetical protein
MSLKVNEPTDAVKAMQPAIDKMAALVGGTEAMRAAGRKYLPQFPLEADEDYAFRLQTSTLYNATGWTIGNLAGKPFSEAVTVTDANEAIDGWLENIDLCGHDITNFAHLLFFSGLSDGLTHVMIDFQVTLDTDGNPIYRTRAQEKEAGLRPYAVHIKQSQILGWITENQNGYEKLVQLRFMECEYDQDGDWGVKEVPQVRVLLPGAWQKWRKKQDGDETWYLYEEGPTSLDFIPFVTYYTRRTGFMTAMPPLEDLADLNIKHWQSQSDQDSLLHTARVPILARIGLQDDPETQAKIGKSIHDLPAGADMKYVEHSGAAIGSGRDSLQDLKEDMRSMGAELLVLQPGDRSATGEALDSAKSQSQLQQMATNLGDFLDEVLDIMARWANVQPGAHAKVFNNFTAVLANESNVLQITQAIIAMKSAGLLDDKSAFEEMQRYGIINADVKWEDVQALIDIQPPLLMQQSKSPVQTDPQQ